MRNAAYAKYCRYVNFAIYSLTKLKYTLRFGKFLYKTLITNNLIVCKLLQITRHALFIIILDLQYCINYHNHVSYRTFKGIYSSILPDIIQNTKGTSCVYNQVKVITLQGQTHVMFGSSLRDLDINYSYTHTHTAPRKLGQTVPIIYFIAF